MSILLLAYPLLIIASVRWELPWLGALALLGLGAHILWPALKRKRAWAWIMMLVLVVAGSWAVLSGDSRALVQLAPMMVFLMLALFFGRTLLKGSTPLVTRIAAAARDVHPRNVHTDMPAELLVYTRRVTAFWALMFLVFVVEDLCMLWLSPPMPWPYLVNLVNFSIVLTLLVVEYLYHSRRYPNPKHESFLDFVRDIAEFDYHSLLDD